MQCFIKPGLWLQRLTAREPSEDQIEVALRALQEVLELEEQQRIGNEKGYGVRFAKKEVM